MSSMLQEEQLSLDVLESRLDEMRKVISSETFSKAPRLCSLLEYIVEKSISRDVDSLTEQQIGIYVFNRSPGYNSNDDNIVRGTARSLRQRLATYYVTEGLQSPVQIDIPKGAYVARFLEIPVREEIPDAITFEPIPFASSSLPTVPKDIPRRSSALWLAWGTALIFAAVACWPFVHEHFVRSSDKSTILWTTMFTHDRPTFIVAGDAGLNMYEGLEDKTVDLAAYSQRDYRSAPGSTENVGDILGSRFYTTASDLQLVSKLVRLPEANSDRVQVRFARDLTVSEIKDANLILMGTRSYNPWTELYQSRLSLLMSWDVNQDLFTVVNRTPQPGEQPVYQWSVKGGTKGGLTLISLTDNSQGSGRVLLIEGTTMSGVFAASDFLSNKQLLDPILTRAQRTDGTLRNFDVLLQSDFIREGVSNIHVLVAHVH